jgi:hypothetical protein
VKRASRAWIFRPGIRHLGCCPLASRHPPLGRHRRLFSSVRWGILFGGGPSLCGCVRRRDASGERNARLLCSVFLGELLILNDPRDYADDTAQLKNSTTSEWIHPLGKIVTSLLDAGLALNWLQEHDSVPWRIFDQLVKDVTGKYRWPDRPWLPLSYSLRAERPLRRRSKSFQS